jgi:hypothetical protein
VAEAALQVVDSVRQVVLVVLLLVLAVLQVGRVGLRRVAVLGRLAVADLRVVFPELLRAREAPRAVLREDSVGRAVVRRVAFLELLPEPEALRVVLRVASAAQVEIQVLVAVSQALHRE